MSGTPRLALPFLSVGQAQKEFVHNEALQILDITVSAAVAEPPRNDPPVSPVIGACYIVGSAPTAEWAGMQQSIAAYTTGGWRFVAAAEGMTAYVVGAGIWAVYRASGWELGTVRGSSLIIAGQQVVGERLPAIASPSGGTTVDSEARSTIDSLLGALRDHGLIEM